MPDPENPADKTEAALRDFVRGVLQDNKHLNDQVTRLQQNNTEKLEEIRALKAALKDARHG